MIRFANKYRLVGVCFHFFGGDPLDAEHISKSGMRDIRNERITINIPWNSEFEQEILIKRAVGTNYMLLMVPKNINIEQFNTVRQAITVGSIVVEYRSGPP